MARTKLKEDHKSLVETPQKKSGGLYFSTPKTDIQFISTGCKTFDLALGGGWARRRISNIVGDKAAGKTLCAIEACANFAIMEPKGKIRYRESEAAFDDNYAEALGFPVDRVERDVPAQTIEDVFEDLTKVIEGAKGPELYIIDSLDALSDREELERDIDKGTYGAAKAKKLSELFRRLVRSMSDKDITLMVVSQIRDNLNAVMFGKKHVRTGGRALDFYASQIAWLTQVDKIKMTRNKVTRVVGTEVKVSVEKNKIALPYREAYFNILFGHGIDDIAACRSYLKDVGIATDENVNLSELHRMVEKHWWETEKLFLEEATSKYRTGGSE